MRGGRGKNKKRENGKKHEKTEKKCGKYNDSM